VALRMKVAREKVTYLSAAAGNDDAHEKSLVRHAG
jgi:hypothetical protein